ncbi:hypothetical protein SAMN02745163_01995 [Clostridium cavendishii DSM 21758]|uniref:Uncharacterized protein n=1 Tax=Clostridium cavendishii DSM 21758 TaxID=1121302 RepID=A0A1M6JDM8_9CLOT|nr:hypothetical protein [Clostridium cavendishii]SHJ44692.1 hypothetical protein SAMN02745163_01995 [Clostridium cavendishii DSM 21758]
MESEKRRERLANIFGGISVLIAIIIFLPILNWYFQITPFQKLQGLPLLAAPVISPIGILFGALSVNKEDNKLGKVGVTANIVLFILPFAYWFIGGFIFGV